MAIPDGEGSAAPGPARRARQTRHRAEKPGLFFRTIIPGGAVTASISCSLIPDHAFQRSHSAGSPTRLRAARQLVVASGSRVTLHTLDHGTAALRELASLQLFAAVRDIRAMSSPVPGRDVLVVLTEQNRVAFIQFDERACRLRVAGQVCVLTFVDVVSESRLVATHPRKLICAVASLASTVVVFPVLFLRKDVSAGKIVRVDIDGVVLGLDFLEDEDGLPSDAILLILVQRGGEQWIAVYTVGAQPGTSGGSGGLSVTHVGSMITCSERPDETAVARHAAKLGTELRAPAQALGLARIPRSPFLFAVFLEGRVVAADARPVIVGALEARDSLPLAVRMRPERHPVHFPSRWNSNSAGGAAGGATGDASGASGESSQEDSSRQAGRDGSDLFADDNGENTSSARTLVPLGMISGTARASRSVTQRRGLASALGDSGRADPYLSFLYVPSCVSLDLGSGEGAPTAWASARDHFCCDPAGDFDEDGMYIVMESGALFALRWSTLPRKGAYVIPAEERTRTGPRRNFSVEYAGHVGPSVSISALDKNLLYIANDGADGSLRRIEPPRIPSAPGTDSRWASQTRLNSDSVLAASSVANVGYGLEVRQEFLNLSPISDFIIIPPGGVEPVVNPKGNLSLGQMKAPENGSPLSASPVNQPRRGSKRGRCASAPQSQKADQDHLIADRRPPRREQAGSPSASSSRRASSAGSAFLNSPTCMANPYSDGGSRDGVDFQGSRPTHRVEAEIVLCCGLQKSGTLRIVQPGAPVTRFSSSGNVFQGCNDMWSIRLSARAQHDSMIALSFTQSTRMLFSVPSTALNGNTSAPDTISHLLDATAGTRIISETRSHIIGRLEDGLLAQVHSNGVRTILFLKKSEMRLPLETTNGEIRSLLVKEYWDWTVPDGHVISTAAIGAKMVFVSIVRTQNRSPCLMILQQHSNDEMTGGLTIVSTLELNDELSCISVPEWTAMDFEEDFEDDAASQRRPRMVILGTYAPSVEVWSLGPGPEMECVAVAKISPWLPASPSRMLAEQVQDKAEEQDSNATSLLAAQSRGNEGSIGHSTSSAMNTDSNTNGQHLSKGADTYSKEEDASPREVLRSAVMTGVPESLCAFESNSKQFVFVGLRNGSILRYCFGDSGDDQTGLCSPRHEKLKLLSRFRIGDVPVSLCRVLVSSGLALIAQAERPWIASTECAELQWMPLAFPETRALCSYSAPGAGRCMATVSVDDVMHICGLRRLTPVSVRSVLVGDTPRRVVALNTPADSLLVATCREPASCSDADVTDVADARRREEKNEDPYASLPYSELKVFHKYTKKLLGRSRLKPDEIVHVLLKWAEFIVVGTSCGLRSVRNHDGVMDVRKGRLLLYSVTSQTATKPGSQMASHWRAKRSERAAFELCSEVAMPGMVMAGAVHSNQEMLVVSSNNYVFVFGKLKNAFFEVARIRTRLMVVSISMYGPTICVADQKDSVGFFRLNWSSGRLVRDRTDPRDRVVADVVLVDARTAIVTDKFGGLFSLAYKDGEKSTVNANGQKGSILSLMPDSVLNELCHAASADNSMTGPSTPRARSWNEGVSDSALMYDDDDSDDEEGTDSQSYLSDTLVESNDGNGQEDAGASENAGNSAMNDVLYEGSVVDTVGTTDGADEDDDVDNEESMDEVEIEAHGIDVVEMEDDEDEEDDEEEEEDILLLGGDEQPVPGADDNVNGGMPAFNAMGLFPNFLPMRTRRSVQMPVLRSLVSYHSFNMRDAALRVRYGTFKRSETMRAAQRDCSVRRGSLRQTAPAKTQAMESFWQQREKAVFAGTLGGALVCAVPIPAAAVNVLCEIGSVLASHADLCGSGLEANHRRFRSMAGSTNEGVVDGDLLQMFLTLSAEDKREVASMAGFVEEDSVFQVETLIEDLCRRVG